MIIDDKFWVSSWRQRKTKNNTDCEFTILKKKTESKVKNGSYYQMQTISNWDVISCHVSNSNILIVMQFHWEYQTFFFTQFQNDSFEISSERGKLKVSFTLYNYRTNSLISFGLHFLIQFKTNANHWCDLETGKFPMRSYFDCIYAANTLSHMLSRLLLLCAFMHVSILP